MIVCSSLKSCRVKCIHYSVSSFFSLTISLIRKSVIISHIESVSFTFSLSDFTLPSILVRCGVRWGGVAVSKELLAATKNQVGKVNWFGVLMITPLYTDCVYAIKLDNCIYCRMEEWMRKMNHLTYVVCLSLLWMQCVRVFITIISIITSELVFKSYLFPLLRASLNPPKNYLPKKTHFEEEHIVLFCEYVVVFLIFSLCRYTKYFWMRNRHASYITHRLMAKFSST